MSKYLWKVFVKKVCYVYGVKYYKTYSKVFSSKQSAMNFVIREKNKGNSAYMSKWYGN